MVKFWTKNTVIEGLEKRAVCSELWFLKSKETASDDLSYESLTTTMRLIIEKLALNIWIRDSGRRLGNKE